MINILKKWAETHFYDFEPASTSKLLRRLEAFASETIAANNERWGRSVRDEIETQKQLRSAANAGGADETFSFELDMPAETFAYTMKRPDVELVREHGKGKKLELAFSGKDAVAWFCQNVSGFITPEQACEIGQRMLDSKVIAPAASGQGTATFADDANALYTFAPLPNDPLTLIYPKPLVCFLQLFDCLMFVSHQH